MKRILTLFILLLLSLNIFATHNRAGEITYKQIDALTYEVTITTYTKIDAPADRNELTINWGDNTTSLLPRINGSGESVGNNIKKNIYKGRHTYLANGIYTLFMLDPNRNEGVLNIPNSVNEPFYIQSIIRTDTGLGYNNSPVLLNPPTDFGCVNTPYIHNVSAFDSDGDSLSYKMVNCRGADGREIETTYTPQYNLDKVRVDEKGTIYWDHPQFSGIYNVAIEISEHRKDPISGEWRTIGRILRDIQIDVTICNNEPPTLTTSDDSYCVIAGEELNFTVFSNDDDGDNISLTAIGGPFLTTPSATFPKLINEPSPLQGDFNWKTDCNLARNAPYQVTFKALDFPHDQHDTPIPGISTQIVVEVKVLAPPLENLQIVENIDNANFDLTWDKTTCGNAKAYTIYRKEHGGDYNKTYCQGGVPEDSGYKIIDIIEGVDHNYYTDTNNDSPLKTGVLYCYIVTAIFEDGSESVASVYECITLKKRLPVITNVDIETTGHSENIQGEINIIWSKPTEIDANKHPGPYAYKLLRADKINGSNFVEIATMNSIDDTIYYDSGMDTYIQGYKYRVDFYDNNGGAMKLIGESYPASSPYLEIKSGDGKLQLRVNQDVPWRIDSIYYYQEIGTTLTFKKIGKVLNEDFIGKTKGEYFIVDGLTNGEEYCFKSKLFGSYSVGGYVKPLINKSQIACGTPNVNELTCPPEIVDFKTCNPFTYTLKWTNPNDKCDEEIVGYKLFYAPYKDAEFKHIETLHGENNTTYKVHETDIVYGCFYVVAFDALSNETKPTEIKCFKPCINIELPNIFTPNGDGINDIYHPKWPKGGSEDFDFETLSFDIEIYNRWGAMMYKTDEVEINWDGTNQMNDKACTEGVYYYVCTIVRDNGAGQTEEYSLTGYIHIVRNLKNN